MRYRANIVFTIKIKQCIVRFLKILPLVFVGLLLTCCSTISTIMLPLLNSGHITNHPIASTGCGKPTTFVPGTSFNQTLVSGGIVRSYLLHIPLHYNTTKPYPLVLNFHGHSSTSLQQERRTDFSAFADQAGSIVAYPQGSIGPDHLTGWDTGPRWDPKVNDVLFVSDLLNQLQTRLCVDPARIYATGFSNGGGMTNMLACDLSGRIAAFASVAGSYPPVPGGCHPSRAVPILEIHGTGDRVVPYNGSPSKNYPPVDQWLQQWASRNDCTRRPIIFVNTKNVMGEEWASCQNHATLVHYRIQQMGHIWPVHLVIHYKGNAKTMIFNATPLIWAFFQVHPLSATSTMSEALTKTEQHLSKKAHQVSF
jgi:polyhydroxybutyrate depolymerase